MSDGIAPAEDTGDESGGTAASLTGVPLTSSDDEDGDDGDGGATDEPGDGSGGSLVAILNIDAAPQLTFESAPALGERDATVVVTNAGSATATALHVAGVEAPFSFAGSGEYPGEGGTCGDALAPDETCTLHLQWAPTTWDEQELAIELRYDDGSKDAITPLGLYGNAEGTTRNLLRNPSFEGNPANGEAAPPQWNELAGDWRRNDSAGCGDGGAPDGSFCAYAGFSSGQAVHELQQTIDISAWADFTSNDQILLRYIGAWRCEDAMDQQRVTIRFLGGGDAMTSFGPQSVFTWDEIEVAVPVPNGATDVRVELVCEKQGGMMCDCLFDDQRLVATYPNPR